MSNCKKYENCSAPLCPLEDESIKNGIWYVDEDICGSRQQQNVEWIKKQKLVVKACNSTDKYFTVGMLNSIKQVRKGVEGVDPDQPLALAYKSEETWVKEKKKSRVVANEKKIAASVVAKKKASSSTTGKKTVRKKKV